MANIPLFKSKLDKSDFKAIVESLKTGWLTHGKDNLLFEKNFARYIGTKWGYSVPDFCKIAVAYNIDSKKISHDNEVNGALKWLFKDEKSRLLEVMVSSNLNVYPKIAFGRTMDEMEPQFSSNQMEST